MSLHTTSECMKDWTIGEDGKIMVLSVELEKYTDIIEQFRLALNISDEEMKARTGFTYLDGFEGFQWLEINMTGLFPFVDSPCGHPGIVEDKGKGMAAFHGSKMARHVAYSREFQEAYNLRQGKRGLYHAPTLSTALEYAKPEVYEFENYAMKWRCVFDIQVHVYVFLFAFILCSWSGASFLNGGFPYSAGALCKSMHWSSLELHED